MPTPFLPETASIELHTPAPWSFEAQGEPNQYFIFRPNEINSAGAKRKGRWLASVQFNGELSLAEQEANLALFDAANRNYLPAIKALEESNRMLMMCRELLADTKHVDKAEHIVGQLVLNSVVLKPVSADGVPRPGLPPLPTPAPQGPELGR